MIAIAQGADNNNKTSEQHNRIFSFLGKCLLDLPKAENGNVSTFKAKANNTDKIEWFVGIFPLEHGIYCCIH